MYFCYLAVLCGAQEIYIPGNTCFSMYGIRKQQGPVPSQGLGTRGDPQGTGQAEASSARVHSAAFSEGAGRMGKSQARSPAQGPWGWAEARLGCLLAGMSQK